MKKFGMIVGTLCVALGLQTAAWADMSGTQPAGTPGFGASATGAGSTGGMGMGGHGMGGSSKGFHPCHGLEEACKAAGYVKGGTAQGKGMWKNCIKPLLDGQTVSGVNVEPTDIAACKEKVSQRSHH